MASSLTTELEALGELIDTTQGRVDAQLTDDARAIMGRADQRLSMGEQTVVALAGPTGAGKSALINALAGSLIATSGVRRPMTSQTLAISFGPTNTTLLDWLDIERRHEVAADDLEHLVLLDLPDHDSVQVAHREEVERLVKVVDQFVWVTDPQKYADASIHQRYLRPLVQHSEVITIVMNQIDRLTDEQSTQVVEHLRQLLIDDGLGDVAIFAVSATTGAGIPELRKHLASIAAGKLAAARRVRGDIAGLARRFDEQSRSTESTGITKEMVARLEAGLANAAGVPMIDRAVYQAMIHRGASATGWPFVSWWRRFRPDPLKRLRLGPGAHSKQIEASPQVSQRSSLPRGDAVATAQLNTSLRSIADQCAGGLPPRWRNAVHEAAHTRAEALPSILDQAMVETDLGTERVPVWWQLMKFVQWLLVIAVLVGVVWLGLNFLLLYLQLPQLPLLPIDLTTTGFEVPTPTVLLVGGLVAGFVVSMLSRVFVGLGAESARRRATRRLRRRISTIADAEVIEPMRVELARHAKTRALVTELR